MESPLLSQINLIARNVDESVAFYRRLGLETKGEPGAVHVEMYFSNGMRLEIDRAHSIPYWDTGWRGETGGSAVLGFSVASRDAVDTVYRDLTGAGYHGRQPPYDAFWGARYAIVDDPDGNGVGLMSPIEAERKFWPPTKPPTR